MLKDNFSNEIFIELSDEDRFLKTRNQTYSIELFKLIISELF